MDLLPDREAGTLAGWLRSHPGTEVICRDRAGAYADGARQGAPQAGQVADRWHLYHNLCQHAEKAVARHRACLQEPAPEPGPAGAGDTAPPAGEPGLARRTRDRYELIQALRAQGMGIKPAMRETGLTRDTVRRYWRAASAEELLAPARDGRPSPLDGFRPYLHQRWNEGATSARQLHAELRERGYTGSYEALARYVAPFRQAGAAPPARRAAPAPPRARDLARWILADPAGLSDDEKATLAQARSRCPHIDALTRHVTEFAKILTGLHGDRLHQWITTVEDDDQPELHSFTRGIKHDYRAVLNGLSLPWSSGAVEGNVNRLKTIKRQMYGRAGFQLLRQRVLLTT